MTTIPPTSAARPGPVPVPTEQPGLVPVATEQPISAPISALEPPNASAAPVPPGDDFNQASSSPFSEAALRLKAGKASHGLQPFLRHRGVLPDEPTPAGADATVEQAPPSEPAASATVRVGEGRARPGSTEPLARLLSLLFSDNERLKRLVQEIAGESIARTLPGLSVSREQIARAVAEKLAAEVPRDQILEGVVRYYPARRNELDAALATIGGRDAVGESPKTEEPRTAQAGLRELLLDLFSVRDVRRLIEEHPGTSRSLGDLPGEAASDSAVARAAAELLLRNLPRNAILEHLTRDRPARRDVIARRIEDLGELGPPPVAGEQPSSPPQQALQRLLSLLFRRPADLNVFLKRIPGHEEWIDKLSDDAATMNQSATVASRVLLANVDPKLVAAKLIEHLPARRQDIVKALGVELGDDPLPPSTVEQEFNSLLCSLFSRPLELRTMVEDLGGVELGTKLPGTGLSMWRMADATATVLLASVGPAAIREKLLQLRPARHNEIDALMRRVMNGS